MDADWPVDRARVSELGLVRGQRVMLLEIQPVAYNPATQTVTLYPDLSVDVQFVGGTTVDQGFTAMPGLERVVLNPELVSTVKTRGSGNYLIVVADSYAAGIVPFANAKTAQGFTVTTHQVADGTANSTIKTYIQGLWGTPDAPDYILLVGDTDTIPAWVGGGAGNPDTDLQYGCMDGSSDWAPDIAVGRFSVRNTTQLATVIAKTLYYENGPLASPEYLKHAVFMASTDNYTISEGTHNYVIDTHMTPNEYISDKLYQVTYGADTQDVRDSFNAGRFYGVYSGHGGTYSWADGPPFSQDDVRGLTNANLYSMVCSFACITGTYTATECFMETWLIEPDKAAVIAVGSSVNSYWDEDDILERVLFDAIFDAEDDVLSEAGPIWNEAKIRLFAHYGDTSTVRRYFEMYNILGDPALALPGSCSDTGTIALDRGLYACEDLATIQVSDCGLNLDDNAVDTVTIRVTSDSEPKGENVILTETAANSASFRGDLTLSGLNAGGVLLVAAGDTITATYIDADDGQGGTNVTVIATAVVDCMAPVISNVRELSIEPRAATITCDADEPVRGTVYYGLDCATLTDVAYGGGLSTTPLVSVDGLQDNTTYYYVFEAADEAGNTVLDDNGGACYSFTTAEIPDYFTELFDSGNDLDNISLHFNVVGDYEYYAGCAEPILTLPTDPAGGTPITLSDDSSVEIQLTGATVSLYGQSYSSIFVGSNGYLTFGASDTSYSESLDAHFDTPRIAALFDDLNPSSGGTVSWKQLGDRVAITYENVLEYSSSNANTFQFELLFSGEIVISYLDVAVTDGLAGLSRGEGTPADFYESDLSNMLGCGPRPPVASNVAATTPINTLVEVWLFTFDDGLPDPPAAVTNIVMSLPQHGTLVEPGVGEVTSVPWAMSCSVLEYTPDAWYAGPDSFTYIGDDGGTPPDGGQSNTATATITVGGAQLVYDFPLDSDPGWLTEGQWAFGTPTGGGSHDFDPTGGFTGDSVYGYNLAGDYTDSMAEYFLTTTALDCTDLTGTEFRFQRWLGVESASYDHATVEISVDGVNWTTVWEHTGGAISDTSWSLQTFDVSAIADGEAQVQFRWGMGTTDGSVTYPGWNIDDIQIWGVVPVEQPPAGDANCDGLVNFGDIDPFVMAITDPAAYDAAYPDCDALTADCNGDGLVNYGDIDPFVSLLTD